jgi:hypothetical protein
MRNLKIKIALNLFLCLICLSVIAQDSTAVNPVVSVVGNHKNWIFAALGIYEIVARLVPTSKNWSILNGIFGLINYIIPNKRKP